MTCEDAPCCGCCDPNESVELIPGENCCEYCLDPQCYGECDGEDDPCEDDMDGDFDSAMASAGYGTDEDYGYYGDGDDYYGGE